MTRRYRDQTFRKTDAVRALRAAQTAGVSHPRLQIDRHGTITIVPGEPPKGSGAGVGAPPDHLNRGARHGQD
jgi:hypothetical protein